MASPYQFFIDQGWTDYQSAAIVGNLMGESNLNVSAIGDGGKAYGIAQWHPDRQANFRRVMGTPIQGSTLNQQLQFVNYELTQGAEQKAGRWLASTTDLNSATYAVMRGYERPANDSSFGKRLNYAKETLLNAGKNLVKGGLDDAVKGAVNSVLTGIGVANPAVAIGMAGSKLLGIDIPFMGGESCGIVCQIRKWITETEFFQRVALIILAFILLAGGIAMLARGQVQQMAKEVIG